MLAVSSAHSQKQHVHGGNGGNRTRVSGENGERRGGARLLDVVLSKAGGKVRYHVEGLHAIQAWKGWYSSDATQKVLGPVLVIAVLTGGMGMTSEQSTIWLVSWPSTASFAIAAANADWSFAWSFTNDCHSHAVRESRASCKFRSIMGITSTTMG